MRRKFLSVVLCVCMMLTMAPFAFAEGSESSSGSGSNSSSIPSANIDSQEALQAAIDSASDDATIALDNDIVLTSPITVTKTITLNMNGKTLSNTTDLWNQTTNAWSLVSVRENGDLTITGNGTFQTKENDCYAVDIQDATAKCTIENGTFVGNVHAIYVFEGSLFVNGGTYSIQQKYTNANQADEFVLNCYDANRRNGSATISVSGGSFINFDPANCQAEGIATNFCADGYTTTNSGETIYTVGTGTNNSVANAGANYNTLQSAINSVEANSSSTQTVTLLKDVVAEDITIPSDKTVTLNLNGKKLTNVSSNTITNNGTLTITGEGTVDNVTHAKAAVWNNVGGTVIIDGGAYTRSAEASTSATNSGNNSYYVIDNYGTLTINKGTFKFSDTNAGAFSSLIHNGWYDGSKNTSGQNAVMTINDGNFTQGTGGKITVKNDDYGELEIKGGVFTQPQSNYYCVYNYNIAKISGGTINGYVGNKYANATCDKGLLEISNEAVINGDIQSGTAASQESSSEKNLIKITGNAKVAGAITSADVKYVTVSGGYFTTDPTAYVASGYAAKSSDKSGYTYMVGQKTNNDVIVKPATANPTVDSSKLPTSLTSDQKTAIKTSAESVNASALGSAASAVGNAMPDAEATNLKAQAKNLPSGDVILYVQSFLDVTPTAYDEGNKTYTLDITPKYQIIASTATTADKIKLPSTAGDTTNTNAVVVKENTVLNVTEPTQVSLTLPNSFVTALGENPTIYVKHVKDNGKTYIYTASLNGNTLTFTNPHGFSEFTVTTTAPVATVDGIGYKSLQDAVDAAANRATIVLNSGTSHTLNLNTTKSVTVKNSTGAKTTITFNGTAKEIAIDGEETFTYTRPSSSSTPTTYAVNVNAATNGAVAADKKTASKGTTVTVTASPSKGYVVDAVKVVDKDGKDVAVTEKDSKYVFTMPASAVTVTGSFKAETPAPVALPFSDVKSGNWFYDAVKYAYEQGLMTGTSATTFAPNGTMNRAMIVTVLYRLEKSPAVTGASKFTDVPAGQWYSDAVAWAAANKIVNGYDETTFGPMNAVTREQMAAILFRYEQVKGLENVTLEENLNRFPDQNKISAYAIPALQWAVGQKIINGNADGTLDPTGTATRAQVAQIFTNLLNK